MSEDVAEDVLAEHVMAGQLAQRPAVRPRLLARPRLTRRLDAGADRRLTVVTGPPGSGKTVLLNEWATGHRGQSDTTRHLSHVRLDERDADPARLWRRVLAQLGAADAGPAGAAGPVDPAAVADVVDRMPGRIVVVLDGFDALGDGPALRSVTALLSFGLTRLRLVIGARTVIGLPVDRLRLDGELDELGADDLAFTAAEARQLWAGRGHHLADPDRLLAATEGWAAAVSLAALTAGSTSDESEERVRQFVQAEILDRMPAAQRDFLARLSVVEAATPELARAITSSARSEDLFDQSVRDGHLRPCGAGWHRCSGPVRAALRREAARRTADEVPVLHRRAADWFVGQGQPGPALRHAGEAGDGAHTVALVLRLATPTLLGPDRARLSEVTTRLPIVDALADPDLAVALAVGAAARGDSTGSQAYAALAEPRLADLALPRRIQRRALLLLSALVPARDDEDVAALPGPARALIDLLGAVMPGLVPHAEPLRVAALEALGTAQLWSGDQAGARRCLTGAVRAADAAGLPVLAARARAGLAMLHCGQGRLAEAAALAERTVAAPAGPQDAPGLARLVLAVGHWQAGRAAAVSRWLGPEDQPVEGGRRTGRLSGLAVEAFRARLLAGTDPGRAREVLSGLSTADVPPLLRDWLAQAAAELHLVEGRPVHALTALGEAGYGRDAPLGAAIRVMAARAYLASAAPARAMSLLAPLAGWPELGPGIRVEAHLVEALAADALGHDGAVTIALRAAMAAAGPDQVVTPFRAPGPASLLARHTDLLTPAFSARLALPAAAPATLVEPITTREGVVLRYLPTLLTLTDIARELSVSPNTVKTHLRHLYRKLGVTSRRDAVRTARRLNLLT
jgi:LuxR family maltose regulon positive regulatory protein